MIDDDIENNTVNDLSSQTTTLADQMHQRFLQTGSVLVDDDTLIDDIYRENGFGSSRSRLSSLMYGFDHESVGAYLDHPKDEFGMVFFTKPRLNLSYDNILQDRIFAPFRNTNPISVARVIKAYLDPVEAIRGKRGSPLVDNHSPFIPILSSSCIQLTGWPDIYGKTYTSKPGLMGQMWSKPDGPAKFYEAFPVNGTFNAGIMDIVGSLFFTWTEYALMNHAGDVQSYLDYILSNRCDFNTRIYVVVLDSTRRYVKKISCCGAAYPHFTNSGQDANFNRESPLNDENKQISVQFTCMGAMYRDGIVPYAFNRIVVDWMPSMHDKYRESLMIQLKAPIKRYANMLGYPRIDPLTSEWQWWIRREDYQTILRRMNNG